MSNNKYSIDEEINVLNSDLLDQMLLDIPVIRNKNWLNFSIIYAQTLDHQYAYRQAFPDAKEGTYTRGGYKLLQEEEVKSYVNYILLNNLRNIDIDIKPSRLLSEVEKMAFSADHKYPAVKRDSLKMLLDLYNGQLLDAFNKEKMEMKEKSDYHIRQYELELERDKLRSDKEVK